MRATWVVGHGLLGSAVARTVPPDDMLFRVPFRFRWGDSAALNEQFNRAVADFALMAKRADDWAIHWTAGVGTMHSDADALATETAALESLLSQLKAHPVIRRYPGRFTFASSAGAIYAGSRDLLISESSEDAPITHYAIAKLQQEKILSEYCRHNPNVAVLMARYSTLYGPEQASGKAQGLLTHISRQVVRGLPVRIYVPLDTIRDYLEVDDAARGMLAASESVSLGSAVTKIVASERPTTISEIIALFRKVSWRPPKIITSMTRSSSLYAKRIQFKSWLRPDLRAVYRTSLVVGISAVLDAERMRYAHDG